MPQLTGYDKYELVSVTGNKPASSLSWHPMLVKFDTDTGLNDYTQNAGLDIAFTLDGSDTELPYDREEWTDNGANVTARFWVRVPSVDSASDTDLRMHIGKAGGTAYATPSDTWNENGAGNFKGVWHLAEAAGWVAGGAGYIKDSTVNVIHGTAAGNADAVAAQIDGGGTFDGTGDYVDCTNSATLNITGNVTVSAWIKTTADFNPALNLYYSIANRGSIFSLGYGIHVYARNKSSNTRLQMFTRDGGGFSQATAVVANGFCNGAWRHVTGVRDGSFLRIYLDGVELATGPDKAPGTNTHPFRIADDNNIQRAWNGQLDEVRVSATDRSAAWALFEYDNIADYASTITHGAWTASYLPRRFPQMTGGISE